jgi:hypothetical protein
MLCSYGLTVGIFFSIDTGPTKTMLVFFILVLSQLAYTEAQHGEDQARGVVGTKQSEEGP